LLDQGHVFFSFTSMEEEMLQAVGTATNKSIPLRGNSCAVSNHIRKARLKLLTLSYFNLTAGRRFLPFGITAISIWFGDYLSLTTQGVLLCDTQHLYLQQFFHAFARPLSLRRLRAHL